MDLVGQMDRAGRGPEVLVRVQADRKAVGRAMEDRAVVDRVTVNKAAQRDALTVNARSDRTLTFQTRNSSHGIAVAE